MLVEIRLSLHVQSPLDACLAKGDAISCDTSSQVDVHLDRIYHYLSLRVFHSKLSEVQLRELAQHNKNYDIFSA